MSKKNLVLLWGWNRVDKSYEGLVKHSLSGWNIYQIPYPDLIPSGNISEMNQKIKQYLSDNGLKRIYLVGHSLGGGLAIKFSHSHPEYVEHLFLLDSVGIPGGKRIWSDILHAWQIDPKYKRYKSESRLNLINRILRNPIGSLRMGLMARRINLEKEAEDLNVPTTIIWGKRDKLIPLWKGKKLHKLIKDSVLVVLKDMSHDWPIFYPQYFWKCIK